MKGIFKEKWIKVLSVFTLALFSSISLLAQTGATIDVKGTISDDLGPVVGANVIVKGTTMGVSTDLDGEFSMKAPEGATLVITFVGYKTQEIKASGQKIDIRLVEDSELLDEVVVIGYGVVKKEDLTGSVVAIKAEEMNKGAVTSPQELIQGKVSGVFIQPSSGQPGGESTIRIRSGASLNASNDPLIVIDGIPVADDAAPGMANGLSSVNPNDIETFTVLKDASATAIYGSRASNGVIIITTKKGKSGRPKIEYSSTYSINSPHNKTKTLSPAEYREVMTEAYGNDTEVMSLLNMYPEVSTNWQDKIFKTAFGTDQNISVSGTTLKMPYRVSFGYNNEDGTIKQSSYKRYTLGVNLSPKFFDDHLSVNLNVKGTYNKNHFIDSGVVGAAAFYDPTKPVYYLTQEEALLDGMLTAPLFNGYWNWATPGEYGEFPMVNTHVSANPVGMLFDKDDIGRTRRSIGNLQLDYKLHWLPELRVNLNLGYDVAKGVGDKGPNIRNFDTYKSDSFKGYGSRENWNNFRRNQLLEFYTNYNKYFESIKSNIDVMAGYSWQWFYQSDFSKNYVSYNRLGKAIDVIEYSKDNWDDNADANEFVMKGARRIPAENYLISFFGRFNYTFMQRYSLTATVRRDGSSKFHEDNRWGTFPSLALAWTISQEKFMQDFKSLSHLKLRLGYGKTGQQGMKDNYMYINNYILNSNPESQYLDSYLMKPGAANPRLKWETTETYNVALDYGFWNNRISGSLEYYQKKTKDLLSKVNQAAGTNFTNVFWENIGNMENEGVEFNTNVVAIDTKDWQLDLGYNVTWNTSKITKLVQTDNESYPGIQVGNISAGTGGHVQRHIVGKAPFTYHLYEQVYDTNGNPIQDAFVDRDGDGVITEADRYLSKSPMPKVYMGFSASLKYKDFDLGMNLRANLGQYVFNEVAAGNATIAGAKSGKGFISNLHETIYKTGFKTSFKDGKQIMSDYFLENASFLKMDNITLGYSFRDFMKSGISGRLSFSVQNVFTITGYDGLDPENSGIDNNIWPRPRTFTFGVNLNF